MPNVTELGSHSGGIQAWGLCPSRYPKAWRISAHSCWERSAKVCPCPSPLLCPPSTPREPPDSAASNLAPWSSPSPSPQLRNTRRLILLGGQINNPVLFGGYRNRCPGPSGTEARSTGLSLLTGLTLQPSTAQPCWVPNSWLFVPRGYCACSQGGPG